MQKAIFTFLVCKCHPKNSKICGKAKKLQRVKKKKQTKGKKNQNRRKGEKTIEKNKFLCLERC